MSGKDNSGELVDVMNAISDEEREQRLKFLDISEKDIARLKALKPVLSKRADRFFDLFYDWLGKFEDLLPFIGDPKVADRLKGVMVEYYKSIFDGDFGPEYFQGRLKVGFTHERIKLPAHWYLSSFSLYLQLCIDIIEDEMGSDSKEALNALRVISKVLFLNMGLGMDTYLLSALNTITVQKKRVDELNMTLEAKVDERVSDIEEQSFKLEEQGIMLNAILNSSREGIVMINLARQVAFANPAAYNLWEMDYSEALNFPLEAYMGVVMRKVKEKDRYPLSNLIEDSLVDLDKSFSIQVEWEKGKHTFDIVSFPVRIYGDHVIGKLLVIRDITKAVEVDRMKNEFFSNVAHELRTPLTSIKGAIGLIAGGVIDAGSDQARELISIANSNTDRLVELVNDFLDVTRLEEGRMRFVFSSCDIQELVATAVDGLGPLMDTKGIRADFKKSGIPMNVKADGNRIIQVLTNLIGNAIKFSGEGSTITVRVSEKGGKAIISVEDEGPGISKENLESIFDKFYQVGETIGLGTQRGTGLGLTISKFIVGEHHGSIWAESELGKGAKFYFTLPLEVEGENNHDDQENTHNG